jgi:hypothetical protein
MEVLIQKTESKKKAPVVKLMLFRMIEKNYFFFPFAGAFAAFAAS